MANKPPKIPRHLRNSQNYKIVAMNKVRTSIDTNDTPSSSRNFQTVAVAGSGPYDSMLISQGKTPSEFLKQSHI